MQLEKLITERRTVHSFLPEKIAWNVVERALELSLWAPNHRLTYPWVYKRLGPQARTSIAEVMVALKEKKRGPLSEAMKASLQSKIFNPSEVILLGLKKSKDKDPMQEREDYATIAASVQIMSLFLWEKGLGSKWTTGGFTRDANTYKALQWLPDQIEIVGAFYIGKPAQVPPPPPRPSLNEVLQQAE